MSEVESIIGQLSGIEETGHQVLSRTYLDSFDRRFRDRNLIVQCDKAADGCTLYLKSADGRLLEAARNNPVIPQWHRDVKQPRLQKIFCRILGPRAMLPVMCCQVNSTHFVCRDEHGKGVAKLSVEQVRVGSDSGPAILLVEFDTIKGYGAESKRFRNAIGGKLPLRRLENDSAILLEEAAGPVQADYTAKPKITISKTNPVSRALADVLSAYRAVMLANEEGMAEDIDPEFLHDFRVAMRRSRSILGAFKDAFPAHDRGHFRQEFAWLTAQTSELRDLDVFAADLERVPLSGESEKETIVEELRAIVFKQRKRALQKVRRMLVSKRYRRFREDWGAVLLTLRRGSSADFGRRQILTAADAAIWGRYRKIRKRITSGRAMTSMEDLHELRKDCKKLRYLVEAFGSLYPAKRTKSAVSELKLLQDVLGDICDQTMQKSILATWLGVAGYEDIEPSIHRTLESLHAVRSRTGKGSQTKRIAPVLARFGSPDNARLYADLFKP